MKTYDFIKQAIGKEVYISVDPYIPSFNLIKYSDINQNIDLDFKPEPLILIKLTKGGMAYVKAKNGDCFSVPPCCIREY